MSVLASSAGVPRRGRGACIVHVALLVGATAACATTGATTTGPASPLDVAALEAAASANPADVQTLTRLGAAYHQAGRFDDARTVLTRAVTAAPNDAPARLYLGLTYEDLGQFGDARQTYEAYLAAGGSRMMRNRIRDRLALLERKELVAAVKRARAAEDSLLRGGQPATTDARTVAVFPFMVPANSELAPLGTALAEVLVTDLLQTSRVRVLERTRVQVLLDELQLTEQQLVDPTTAARSGRILGAGRIVQGSLALDSPEQLRMRGAVVPAIADSLSRMSEVERQNALNRLYQLQFDFAVDVYRALGVELTPAELERLAQRPTRNLQALLEYGLGLEAWDRDDYRTAQRHFSSAADRDAGFRAALDRASTAAAAAAAASTTTGDLSRLGLYDLQVVAVQWGDIEQLVPGIGRRDAASEVLGREGLGFGSAWLDIILQRR